MGKGKVEHYIDLLKMLAMHSSVKHKHACAVLQNGKLCGVGINKYLPGKGIRVCLHSEIDAMAGVKTLKGKDLLVIRISSSNTLRMSKPCSGCLKKIKANGINKVYYSTNEETIAVENAADIVADYHCSMTQYRNRLRG